MRVPRLEGAIPLPSTHVVRRMCPCRFIANGHNPIVCDQLRYQTVTYRCDDRPGRVNLAIGSAAKAVNRDHRRVRTPGMPRPRTTRALAAVVAAGALLLLGAGPASAHDEVVATTPAAQASVPAPPAAFELELTSPPQVLGTEVRVTGPDGDVVSEGEPEVLGTTVRQPLAGGLPAGTYAVDWRVTSGDGHPVTGSSAFTVDRGAAPPSSAAAVPGEAAGSRTSQPAVDETSASTPADTSSSTALLGGGALVVLAAAGLVVWRLRRQA